MEDLVKAQELIAGAMEELETASGDACATRAGFERFMEGFGIADLAVNQSGHRGLAVVSGFVGEQLLSRWNDAKTVTTEEALQLFEWVMAVGEYLEDPSTSDVQDFLLAPLPEELKARGRDALQEDPQSEAPDESDERLAGYSAPNVKVAQPGSQSVDQGVTGFEVAAAAFPEDRFSEREDSRRQAQENVPWDPVDADLADFAPEEPPGEEAAEGILDVLCNELGEISPLLAAHAATIADKDELAAEQAAAAYVEIVGRVLTASKSVGLDGVVQIAEFVCENIRLGMEGGRPTREKAWQLFAGWPEVVQAHLREPMSDKLCLAVADYLEQDAWPEPLSNKQLRILLEGLTKELVVTGDAAVEGRTEKAAAEDISLDIDQDANQALVDAFLTEAPGHAEELSRLIGEMIAGKRIVANIQASQRITHTLKGSANLIALKGVANFSHHLEDIFEYLASKRIAPPPAMGLCLQEAADTIEAMLEAFQGLTPAPADAQQVLQSVLDWANRVDRGLRASDLTPVGVDTESDAGRPDEESAPIDGALDLLRVPRQTIDTIFKMVGESSIALGQAQERLKRLSSGIAEARGQDLILQQRRFDLENLVSVRGLAARQLRIGDQAKKFDPLEMEEYDEYYGATHAFIEAVADSREAYRQMANELMRFEALYLQQQRLNKELQDAVLTTRMIGVKTVSARLHRAVRQACRATGKKAELRIVGEELMLDGDVLGKLVDPLMHVLRNAIDHGIELPSERVEGEKSETGEVVVAFSQAGNTITVRIVDDGQGLDYPRIREQAVAKGLLGASEEPDHGALANLLLQSGFSTRNEVTHISGRGVGMDVVKNTVVNLNGNIDIGDNSPSGAVITLRIPITLLTSHSLLIRARNESYAVPTATLEQILSADAGEFQAVGGKVVYRLNDEIFPASALSSVLFSTAKDELAIDNTSPVLLIKVDNEIHAVAVDQVVGSYDLVIKSLGPYVGKVPGISGVSILGDGDVVPVLDMVELLGVVDAGQTQSQRQGSDVEQPMERPSFPQILIVDDSLSVRNSLSQLVQDAGLKPLLARDGVEALEVMRKQKPDLVLTDLEMPRMSGLELSVHIRATEEVRDIPVIMVTSRTMQKHRDEAERSGVDLYVTKPFAEDDLIGSIHSMLAR